MLVSENSHNQIERIMKVQNYIYLNVLLETKTSCSDIGCTRCQVQQPFQNIKVDERDSYTTYYLKLLKNDLRLKGYIRQNLFPLDMSIIILGLYWKPEPPSILSNLNLV